MIDYLGVKIDPAEVDRKEVAKFCVGFLNTTKNALFDVKTAASPAAIENVNFDAGEYITTKVRCALRKYCKIRGEKLTLEEWEELYKKIKPDIERCAEEWRKGNKNFIIKDLWRNTN